MNYFHAQVELPLPDGRTAARARVTDQLANGQDTDQIDGCDLLVSLDLIGESLGVIQPASGYKDDLVFCVKEDGSIGYEQIYSAVKYPVSFVRRVVASAVTADKYCPLDVIQGLKSVHDIIKALS